MKFAGCFILVSVLLAAALASAQDAAVSSKPYAPIVTRNVFGLVPIPVVDPAASLPPPEPPPKITPNGIMTIFGQLQVLFKVAVKPPPGQPAKDDSFVMSEGERQDEIEVVKIDEAAGVITFNNHGTVQELPLVATPASSGAPAGPGGGPGTRGNPGTVIPSPMSPPGGGPAPSAGNDPFGRPPPMVQQAGGPSLASTMPGFGGAGRSGTANTPQPQEALSPEAQVLMIEAQRAKWIQEGNPGAAILPPTPLTPEVTGQNPTPTVPTVRR
jgi:hypothetical protein